jgi:hypothetical protein
VAAEPDTTYILEHSEGGEFYAGLTFSNSGPIGVTVEQVEKIRDESGFVLYPVEVVMPPEGTILGRAPRFDRWETFKPFALGAGEQREVAVKYQFGRCRLERGASTWIDSLSTRFSVLGVPRHTTFKLPYVLVVQARGQGEC